MNLHRADKKPDWENIPKAERSTVQKIASATKGIVTPANAVSVAGLVLTHGGLKDMYHGNVRSGIAKVFAGRAMDVADGYVADKTGTKSSVGEKFDATIDKLLMADALYLLYKKDTIPKKAAVFIGMQNIVNTVATGVAMARHTEMHPSREGKLTTALQWAAIGGFCVDAAKDNEKKGEMSVVRNISEMAVIASSAMGLYVNADYIKTAFSSQE